MLIGYIVDGQFVTVNRLEHYIHTFGGSNVDFVFEHRRNEVVGMASISNCL